jgi:hypothetical protein
MRIYERSMPQRKSVKKVVRKKDAESPVGDELRGWVQIAAFLGQPSAVAQRWSRSGMPVSRKGRYVTASKAELSRWLGRESGIDAPVHIASDPGDLTRDLKRGLTYVRDASSRKKNAR